MKSKTISSVAALALCGAMSTGVAYAQSTQSTVNSSTTVERSTTNVEVPKARAVVKEEATTTTTKRGVTGAKKETTTSSSTRVESEPAPVTNSEVRSRTTVETKKSY
ncbi:MAG: hypothetical protein ABIS45_00505 [Burkholderiales bacterium]